jgi:hypothetical protein
MITPKRSRQCDLIRHIRWGPKVEEENRGFTRREVSDRKEISDRRKTLSRRRITNNKNFVHT